MKKVCNFLKHFFKNLVFWSVLIMVLASTCFIVFSFIRIENKFPLADAFLSLSGGLFASGLLALIIELISRNKLKRDAIAILSPLANACYEFALNVSTCNPKPDDVLRTYSEWIELFVNNINDDSCRGIVYRYLQHLVEISNYQSNLLDYFRSNPYSTEKQRKIVTSFNKKSRFLLQQIEKYQSFNNYDLIKRGLIHLINDEADSLFPGLKNSFSQKYSLPVMIGEELERMEKESVLGDKKINKQ